jgi:hypothetical protein
MIVQAINVGDDLKSKDMSILTPGGGVGASRTTGCRAQYGTTWYVKTAIYLEECSAY